MFDDRPFAFGNFQQIALSGKLILPVVDERKKTTGLKRIIRTVGGRRPRFTGPPWQHDAPKHEQCRGDHRLCTSEHFPFPQPPMRAPVSLYIATQMSKTG